MRFKLEEIDFDVGNEKSAREAALENAGSEVILEDGHNGWIHGLLRPTLEDEQCYKVTNFRDEIVGQFWYHDLRTLVKMRKFKYNPQI